jgi:hypothetical protein
LQNFKFDNVPKIMSHFGCTNIIFAISTYIKGKKMYDLVLG